MRKLVYGALALSAALAVGFGTGAKDAKADAGVSEIKTLGDDTLTINAAAGTSKILVGVPSFKSFKGEDNKTVAGKQIIAVSTWDVYDGATAKVDLSKYPKTKDTYLMIKTDFQYDEEAVAVKIPASLSLSASYDKKSGEITITNADTDKTALTESALNYYTDSHSAGTITLGGDSHKTGTIADIKQYEMSGATLYVETQLKAKTTGNTDSVYTAKANLENIVIGTGSSKKDILEGDGAGANPAQAYVFAARSSKPVKLNITKLANAPKVTPNYTKGTITIPKGATAEFVSVDNTYNTASDTRTFVTPADKAGTLNISNKNEKWSTSGDNAYIGSIDARADFAIDIYTTAVTGDKAKLASRSGRYLFNRQYVTCLSLLDYSISYASGKYTGLVESEDSHDKYTIYYTDATNKDKTVTTSLCKYKENGDIDKIGSAKLANIDITKPIYVTCDGNAKYQWWIGTKVRCTDWETKNSNDDNVKKYDVVVAKKNADKDDTDVVAAYNLINTALTTANKTYKKDQKVEIDLGSANQSKLDAVLITVDNAVSTDSDKLTISGGKIKFTMKADKKTTITVAKQSFAVSVVTSGSDNAAGDVAAAKAAIEKKVKDKKYKKGDTVRDVEKAFSKEKVTVTCSGGISLDGSVYKLTSAAAGVLTVSLADGNADPTTYAVIVTGSDDDTIVYSDEDMADEVSDTSAVEEGTVLYIKRPYGKAVTITGVTPTDVEGGYKITVTKKVTIAVADRTDMVTINFVDGSDTDINSDVNGALYKYGIDDEVMSIDLENGETVEPGEVLYIDGGDYSSITSSDVTLASEVDDHSVTIYHFTVPTGKTTIKITAVPNA